MRMVNGFNSRCLHVITGEDYRTTATVPAFNLVLVVRKRRLRYLGHVLRLPAESIVRRSLLALVKRGTHYPEGSLFRPCSHLFRFAFRSRSGPVPLVRVAFTPAKIDRTRSGCGPVTRSHLFRSRSGTRTIPGC